MLTRKQEKFIEQIEFALARFVYDDRMDLARVWEPIVEALHNEHFVIAVCMAEERPEIPEPLVDQMCRLFDVRRLR